MSRSVVAMCNHRPYIGGAILHLNDCKNVGAEELRVCYIYIIFISSSYFFSNIIIIIIKIIEKTVQKFVSPLPQLLSIV